MQCQRPEYTEEARLAHLAGFVTVSLIVDDEGMPADIHVVDPIGLGLDESAVACMSQSGHSPAQKDGKPVPLSIKVSLPFQEHWAGDWHLGAAAFRPAEGATRPILVKAKFPEASADRRNLTVCLKLTVGKDGAPREVRVAAPHDSKLDGQAVAIVSSWRFRPGMQNREPVDVPGTLTLVHGGANGVVAGGSPPK